MSFCLEGLSDEQKKAVTATEGYYRVIAGAGSGKTRALSYRFAYLVTEIGILPSSILCATFTNRAAAEMKRRIRALIGDCDTAYIGTFHSFCVSVLQEDVSAVGYPKNFLVLDNADIDGMLRQIYEERGLTLRDMTFARARDMIEIRKVFKEPDYYNYLISLPLEELRRKYLEARSPGDIIFYGYLYQQKKCFALDYNDLIKFVLHIFEAAPEIREKWQRRLEYVMVDEFQDIDELQYRLMKSLCAYHGNLFVVGDPDQTIYTWRGANVKYLLDFDKEFPGTKTIMMVKNYRSTPQILAAANSLIACNKNRIKKDLIPTLPDGGPVLYHHAATAEEEAVWIARQIKKLAEQGERYCDIAVLYRAHFVSRALEEAFLKENVPYVVTSGAPFYARAEVKDALSYLRLVVYQDDLSFLRVANVPKRNLGERRMKYLQEYAEKNGCTLFSALERSLEDDLFKNTKARDLVELVRRFISMCRDMPVSELLGRLLDESGYEAMLRTEGSQERLDNLSELKQSIHEFETACGEETTPEYYLARVATLTNLDALPGRDAVRLMTVHTAKGLEFPHVFLCGLNEGIFPSKKTLTLEGMEEERRLAFVAFTRAQKGLYLSDAEGKNHDGSFRYPSRFIFNVGRDHLSFTGELDSRLAAEAGWAIGSSEKWLEILSRQPVFKPGDRVFHSVMGAGEVIDVDAGRGAYTVKFDSLPTSRLISMKARLEPAE